jgi:glc operon protein GlcG
MSQLLLSQTISRELARVGIDRAIEESIAMGRLTCIAVLNSAGQLISFDRMDGAPFQSTQLAQDKAFSVAGNGLATHQFWEMIADDPWLVHNVGQVEGLVVLGGGVPLRVDGQLVGAVGVSGKSNMAEDRAIAEAAVSAMLAAINNDKE